MLRIFRKVLVMLLMFSISMYNVNGTGGVIRASEKKQSVSKQMESHLAVSNQKKHIL